jgi:hypothetical protein
MYRVLGKGGFGEVCACQVRIRRRFYEFKIQISCFHLRSKGESDWKDVRVQETREEADKEAKGRIYGAHRETNSAENQLAIRGQSGVCL